MIYFLFGIGALKFLLVKFLLRFGEKLHSCINFLILASFCVYILTWILLWSLYSLLKVWL